MNARDDSRAEFADRYEVMFGAFPAKSGQQAAIWWHMVDRLPAYRFKELFDIVEMRRMNMRVKPRMSAFLSAWKELQEKDRGPSSLAQLGKPTPVEQWMMLCRWNSLVIIQKFVAGDCPLVKELCERANVEVSHENAARVALAIEMHRSMGSSPPLKEGENLAAPDEEEWYWRCKNAGVFDESKAQPASRSPWTEEKQETPPNPEKEEEAEPVLANVLVENNPETDDDIPF